MSWCRAPLWDLRSDTYYFLLVCCCLKFAVLFLWGALSDEKMGLQFAVQSLNGLRHAEPITKFYCLIWNSPNLDDQVLAFIFPRNRVTQLYPQALCSLYLTSCNSQGYGECILTLPKPGGPGPHIYILQEQDGPVQNHVTTDGQSISMSWCLVHSALKGSIWTNFNPTSGGVH
jgi:hypothetical protein